MLNRCSGNFSCTQAQISFIFAVVDVFVLFFFVAAVIFPGDSLDFLRVSKSSVKVSFLDICDSDSTTPNATCCYQEREETKYRLRKHDGRYLLG